MCCLSDWLPWSVSSVVLCVGCAACACGLVAVVCVGGMVCLWWSVPSVLGVGVGWSACGIGCRGQYPRHTASGEPVAVVSVGGMVCHSSSGEGVGW